MTDTTVGLEPAARELSLPARIAGVVLSPRATYAAVAARPRILGVLLVTLAVTGAVQGWFLTSEAGQQAMRDAIAQQIRQAQAQGGQVPAEAGANVEQIASVMGYVSAGAFVLMWPILLAILAGFTTGVGNALLGVKATFRHVYAVYAHAGVVMALATIFTTALMYLTGDLVSPTRLAVFLPMLPEQSFLTYFLGALDLVWIWAIVSLGIGLAVLYKQRTGPLATLLLGVYAAIALLIAAVRAF